MTLTLDWIENWCNWVDLFRSVLAVPLRSYAANEAQISRSLEESISGGVLSVHFMDQLARS